MKKVLCISLAIIIALATIGCSSKEEKLFNEAIKLFESRDYASALAIFKELEPSDEINSYIRQSSYYVLADYIFINGMKGNEYGQNNEGDRYFITIPGTEIVLSVKLNDPGYDDISFSMLPNEPRGVLTSEAYSLTIYEKENVFSYFYSLILGTAMWNWQSENIQQSSYTRDTGILFNITKIPESLVWQFSGDENESMEWRQDECNNYLDEISIILRKLDIGVTLKDLGFLSF